MVMGYCVGRLPRIVNRVFARTLIVLLASLMPIAGCAVKAGHAWRTDTISTQPSGTANVAREIASNESLHELQLNDNTGMLCSSLLSSLDAAGAASLAIDKARAAGESTAVVVSNVYDPRMFRGSDCGFVVRWGHSDDTLEGEAPERGDYFGFGFRFLTYQPVSKHEELGTWVGYVSLYGGRHQDAMISRSQATYAGTKILFPIEVGYQYAPRKFHGLGARVMAGIDGVAIWYTIPGSFYEKVNANATAFFRRPLTSNVEVAVELGYRHDNGSAFGGDTGERAWLRGNELVGLAMVGFRRGH